MRRRTLLFLLFAAASAVVLAVACGPAGFTSEDQINSVRILATRADNDKSFAKPGDTVTLETLTLDGRTNKTPPAVTYWIPYVCENPIDDAYYGCFAPLLGEDAGIGGFQFPPTPDAGGEDGGALDGGAGEDAGTPLSPVITPAELATFFVPKTDITASLPKGPYTFVVPKDAITSHPVVAGAPAPYGLIILFNIACAGHVWTTSIDPSAGPQQVPITCGDAMGNPLGPDQYVIGFTRVYVYATLTNANPVINGFFFDDAEAPVADAGGANPAPITVKLPPCTGDNCNAVNIDMDVPQSSWAPDPKMIWVDYYTTGNLGSEAKLLYDQNAGRVSDSLDPVTFSDDGGTATIWAVVHDSNEGVTWLQVNVVP
jgi:hypothetical protein